MNCGNRIRLWMKDARVQLQCSRKRKIRSIKFSNQLHTHTQTHTQIKLLHVHKTYFGSSHSSHQTLPPFLGSNHLPILAPFLPFLPSLPPKWHGNNSKWVGGAWSAAFFFFNCTTCEDMLPNPFLDLPVFSCFENECLQNYWEIKR